jgi:hypothetical protein
MRNRRGVPSTIVTEKPFVYIAYDFRELHEKSKIKTIKVDYVKIVK